MAWLDLYIAAYNNRIRFMENTLLLYCMARRLYCSRLRTIIEGSWKTYSEQCSLEVRSRPRLIVTLLLLQICWPLMALSCDAQHLDRRIHTESCTTIFIFQFLQRLLNIIKRPSVKSRRKSAFFFVTYNYFDGNSRFVYFSFC
jgi:hypothetical protein